MKIKSTTLAAIAISGLGMIPGQAATIILDNTAGGLGYLLDGLTPSDIGTARATMSVPGFAGLNITFLAVTTNGTGTGITIVNSTAVSLGINSPGTDNDNNEAFDSTLSESLSFSFNQDVEISSLDFTAFTSEEVFNFGGQVIEYVNLSNQTSGIYTFSEPLAISAGTSFILQATSGTIGIEGLQLTVVPEPSAALLGAFGALGLLRRRR
jgi:predicted ATPase